MRPEHEITGAQLSIGPLDEAHADGPYLQWLLDEEITRFLEARFTQYDANKLRSYIANENARDDAVLFGVFLLGDGRLIGTVKLSQIRLDHRNCNIGLMIGDKRLWGKGLGTEVIELSTQYAFESVGLHKVLAGVYSDNIGSERAFLNAGYAIEARLRDDRWNGQNWVDRILLGCVNPDASHPCSGTGTN